MEKFLVFWNSIDWTFAAIILIGGRYWGGKYFNISKKPELNFLAFATLFAAIWILIVVKTMDWSKSDVGDLFITYLFVTSFYELLGQHFFQWLENKVSKIKNDKE